MAINDSLRIESQGELAAAYQTLVQQKGIADTIYHKVRRALELMLAGLNR